METTTTSAPQQSPLWTVIYTDRHTGMKDRTDCWDDRDRDCVVKQLQKLGIDAVVKPYSVRG